MEKMWAGRFQKELDREADDFNSSIHVDQRMFRQDIRGSVAHAAMLAKQGILTEQEGQEIIEALGGILQDIEDGALAIDPEAEDIHMFIESVLTKRIGDLGKKLHTARSRNDQVAVDIRLYLRDETAEILGLIKELIGAVAAQAKTNANIIMPGYTHLQRAQPITFGHHLLACCMMLIRDCGRLEDAMKRMNQNPLGACALAGTTYHTDRAETAKLLGFDGYTLNSIDSVSDRDFCLELLSAFSVLMMHLSRFSEEIILWSSWEFKFVELDDSYTTGSSIMPQKKNPDMAELVRGKTGRVYGDLMALLTTLKGLPLAYNKDMQEDKEAIFDSIDTVKKCLRVFTPMIATMKAIPENMDAAAGKGFINATDRADYLVKKGLPFRTAYKIVGQTVARAIEEHKVLDALSLETLKEFSPLFEADVYEEISLET
ncbi:MAG: argininosuccinate lyase, partial [Clostridia bacterium]|nr:argininosuccinate lyase [Clostridia bacterium]